MWVEGAGHAASEPEAILDSTAIWPVGGSRQARYGIRSSSPATDASLIDAWFRSGFGIQHTHGIRRPAAGGDTNSGLRTASTSGLPKAVTSRSWLDWDSRSPSTRAGLTGLLDGRAPDPRSRDRGLGGGLRRPGLPDVRGRDGREGCRCGDRLLDRGLVGASRIVRPPNAAFLGFAAVLPQARGLGAGRVLGEAVPGWARDAGYATVVTDWRETNLLSSRRGRASAFDRCSDDSTARSPDGRGAGRSRCSSPVLWGTVSARTPRQPVPRLQSLSFWASFHEAFIANSFRTERRPSQGAAAWAQRRPSCSRRPTQPARSRPGEGRPTRRNHALATERHAEGSRAGARTRPRITRRRRTPPGQPWRPPPRAPSPSPP